MMRLDEYVRDRDIAVFRESMIAYSKGVFAPVDESSLQSMVVALSDTALKRCMRHLASDRNTASVAARLSVTAKYDPCETGESKEHAVRRVTTLFNAARVRAAKRGDVDLNQG